MIRSILGALFALTFSLPALADAIDQKNKDWNVDVKLIEKLAKKKQCADVVMYREVLPFFGMEATKQASKDITIQFEKEDLASGRAIILHEKTNCDQLVGNFLVMCTTDTALCYFKETKNIGKGKKLPIKKAKTKSKKSQKIRTIAKKK